MMFLIISIIINGLIGINYINGNNNIIEDGYEILNKDDIQFFDKSGDKNRILLENNNDIINVKFNTLGNNYDLKLNNLKSIDEDDLFKKFNFKIGDSYKSITKDKFGNSQRVGIQSNINECIYIGTDINTGNRAVLINCDNQFIISVVEFENTKNEKLLEVKKQKGKETFEATRTESNLEDKINSIDNGGRKNSIKREKPKTHNRSLQEGECATRPQKYLSLVIVNTPSRILSKGSIEETEADTLSIIALGSAFYSNFDSTKGCNVAIVLTGQVMYDNDQTNPIRERRCNEKIPLLESIQLSHNSNTACCTGVPNGDFSKCNTGITKCWKTVPSIDFATAIGCISFYNSITYFSNSREITYFEVDAGGIKSTDETKVDIELFLYDFNNFISDQIDSWTSEFDDVDAAQAWTGNKFYINAGLGNYASMCYQSSGSVCSFTYTKAAHAVIWAHELGHNLALDHTGDGGVMAATSNGFVTGFSAQSSLGLENYFNNYYGVDDFSSCLEINHGKTSSPTMNPIKVPTSNPIRVPTKNPTPSPTKIPTKKPTFKPTKNPTKKPTNSPTTLNPTKNPTFPCSSTNSKICVKDIKCVWNAATQSCNFFDCTILKKKTCLKAKKTCKWESSGCTSKF